MNTTSTELTHDLGNFEGFNFRDQSAIERILSAQEVVDWDHDRVGEAEFWPDGDQAYVWLLFKSQSNVTAGQLQALDNLLCEMGDDSQEAYLKIFHCVDHFGYRLEELSAETVQDSDCLIYTGDSFTEIRRQAAYDIFETYYPEEYEIWDKSLCDGLVFDDDKLLDSPVLSVAEIRLPDQVALLISWN